MRGTLAGIAKLGVVASLTYIAFRQALGLVRSEGKQSGGKTAPA